VREDEAGRGGRRPGLRRHVEDARRPVAAGRGDAAPVGRERDPAHGPLVTGEARDLDARRHIEEAGRPVVAAGEEPGAALRVEAQGLHGPVVGADRPHLAERRGDVADDDLPARPGRGEETAVGREGDADALRRGGAREDEARAARPRLEEGLARLAPVVEEERPREKRLGRGRVAREERAPAGLRERPGEAHAPRGPLRLGPRLGVHHGEPGVDGRLALALGLPPRRVDLHEGDDRADEAGDEADGGRGRDGPVALEEALDAAGEVHGPGARGLAGERAAHVVRELEGRLVAVLRPPLHGLRDDRLDRGRDAGAERAERRRVLQQHLGEDGDRRALEGRPSREEVVERRPERVHVRPRADEVALVPDLLRRHVVRRADEVALGGEAGRVDLERDPEVREARLSGRVDEDVRGLDVAVDDPAPVRLVEGEGDLADDRERLGLGERAAPLEDAVDVDAVHELHGDVELALGLADVLDLHEVRVPAEAGDRPGLADEALARGGVGDLAPEDLERAPAPEERVRGAVNRAHGPAPELGLDLVGPEAERPLAAAHGGPV
jgi:hypothetical protein